MASDSGLRIGNQFTSLLAECKGIFGWTVRRMKTLNDDETVLFHIFFRKYKFLILKEWRPILERENDEA